MKPEQDHRAQVIDAAARRLLAERARGVRPLGSDFTDQCVAEVSHELRGPLSPDEVARLAAMFNEPVRIRRRQASAERVIIGGAGSSWRRSQSFAEYERFAPDPTEPPRVLQRGVDRPLTLDRPLSADEEEAIRELPDGIQASKTQKG